MRRIIVGSVIGALAVAGCANNNWVREGATPQELAVHTQACDAYVMQEQSIVGVSADGQFDFLQSGGNTEGIKANIRAQQAIHPKVAAWRTQRLAARHASLVKGGHVVRASSGSNDMKAELAAAAAVLLIAMIADASEKAALHDECMTAFGWVPAKG